MPILRHCLCWREVRTGSVAAGVMATTISFIQIFVQIAIWTGNESIEQIVRSGPYLVYIPMAALDFLVIVFSVILLIGIERDMKGRHMLLPWVILIVLYLCYEAAVNIYFFVQMFPWAESLNEGYSPAAPVTSPLNTDANVLAMLIVLVVYWLMKCFLYIIGILCVISRYQEIRNHRRKYYRHHLNDSFDVPMPRQRDYVIHRDQMARDRDFIARDRDFVDARDPYNFPPLGMAAPPPIYPADREDRARADYKTPRATQPKYLDPKRYEAYGPPAPGSTYNPPLTPRIYPQHDMGPQLGPQRDERRYHSGRY